MPAVLVLLSSALSLGACERQEAGAAGTTGDSSQPATNQEHAAALAALHAADSALMAAVAARDAERTAALYAPDAVLLPAAAPQISGHDAIRAEWIKLFAIPGFANTARMTHLEVAAGGDLAFTRGDYETQLTGHDGKLLTEHGKWVSIWRRQADGAWRIIVDMYNTDTAPPDHL